MNTRDPEAVRAIVLAGVLEAALDDEFEERTGTSRERAQELADDLGLPLAELVPKLEAEHATWTARYERANRYLRDVYELAQNADEHRVLTRLYCRRCTSGKEPRVAFVVPSRLGPLLVSFREVHRSHPTERRNATISEWKQITGTARVPHGRVGHVIAGPNTYRHLFPWDSESSDAHPAAWCPRHGLLPVETRRVVECLRKGTRRDNL